MLRFENRAIPIVLAAVTIDVIGFWIVMPVLIASVVACFGLLVAAQSLAWDTRNGFDGAAFLVAGVLIGISALIIAFGTPRHLPDAPSTQET